MSENEVEGDAVAPEEDVVDDSDVFDDAPEDVPASVSNKQDDLEDNVDPSVTDEDD